MCPQGWHTCDTSLGSIFSDRPLNGTGDVSYFGAKQAETYYPRSTLEISLSEGDVHLDLTEALPFSDVWARHLINKAAGWDCSLWGCTDTDECSSSPCQHGGVCKDSLGLNTEQLSPAQREALELFGTEHEPDSANCSNGSNGSNDTNCSNDSNGTNMSENGANMSNGTNRTLNGTGPVSIAGIANMPAVSVGWFNCSCPPTFAGDRCEIAKEYTLYRIRTTASASGGQVCIGELWFYGLDGARTPKIGIGSTSHWRDCHFADTLSASTLKHLLKDGRGGCSRMTFSPTARGHREHGHRAS